MKNPLKKVCKKAVKAFKNHSNCKGTDESVGGLVRYKGKVYHIAVTAVDETNFCVPIPQDGQGKSGK